MLSTKKILIGGMVAMTMAMSGCLTSDDEPAGTALSAATDFTFRRVSLWDTIGLDVYGLAWTQNVMIGTALTPVITKGTASKLSVLSAADWTAITTKEGLKARVDSAADAPDYRGVNFENPPNTYDNVIATINSGTYYMLHITGTDDQPDPDTLANQVRTIMGQSKY